MFNKDEGGFRDRDLYVWAANISDGILTAHPQHKGKHLQDFEGILVAKTRLGQAAREDNFMLRHAFEFANRSFDKNADPFAASIIRCTCGNAVDNKMISKWSRALRYAARSKVSDSRLRTFMKEAGGVNACADRYAMHCGRNHRR